MDPPSYATSAWFLRRRDSHVVEYLVHSGILFFSETYRVRNIRINGVRFFPAWLGFVNAGRLM